MLFVCGLKASYVLITCNLSRNLGAKNLLIFQFLSRKENQLTINQKSFFIVLILAVNTQRQISITSLVTEKENMVKNLLERKERLKLPGNQDLKSPLPLEKNELRRKNFHVNCVVLKQHPCGI